MNRLVWFRNDLRLHDNEMLAAALADDGVTSFLYVYDAKWDAPVAEGFPRVGRFPKQFIAESVIELRDKLRALGADLICVIGDPVDVVADVCAQLKVDEIFFSRLSTFNERKQEAAIERSARARGVRCRSFITHTLLHPDDFRAVSLIQPMGFSKLRKIAETGWNVQAPRPTPTRRIDGPASSLNRLVRWGPEDFVKPKARERGIHPRGGESVALDRVTHYFWTADRLRVYKQTRNGLIDLDDSSKFSAPLALGCVSARYLYAEVRRYERERTANWSTQWFLYELLWRDFFHFSAHWRGRGLFTEVWTSPSAPGSKEQEIERFDRWREGRTESAFINAAMTELRLTGWMSNRMRQNAASYLVHDLGVDWRRGARWFEHCLVDHDAASNWGNWAYVAGAGPRNQPHVFDVEQQREAYDPEGAYERHWSE